MMLARAPSLCLRLLALPALAAGHAAMVTPHSRNAVDADLSPWNQPVGNFLAVSNHPKDESKPMPNANLCPVGKGGGAFRGDNGTELSGENGQSCFWFSQGCSIGCPKCLPQDPMNPGPSHAGKNTDFCNNTMKPTICDDNLRTFGKPKGGSWPSCGGPQDRWASTPWRAPGTAPVLDPCGMAGGTPAETHSGAQYYTTPHARQGDLGSKTLKPTAPIAKWTSGGTAEVSWTINANHGGGYSYRICPRASALSEDCFQKLPLEFVNGSQTLRWDGANGTTKNIGGQYVVTGTHPAGSSWAKNPIPRGGNFPPPCDESPGCEGSDGHRTACKCSGAWGPYNLEIVDTVKVPKVPAGEYVVGWRWDCEESAQVWQNCADITIAAGDDNEVATAAAPITIKGPPTRNYMVTTAGLVL